MTDYPYFGLYLSFFSLYAGPEERYQMDTKAAHRLLMCNSIVGFCDADWKDVGRAWLSRDLSEVVWEMGADYRSFWCPTVAACVLMNGEVDAVPAGWS